MDLNDYRTNSHLKHCGFLSVGFLTHLFVCRDMYEQEDDYAEEGEDSEEISNEIWQEACWIVISAYFDEKGQPKELTSLPV